MTKSLKQYELDNEVELTEEELKAVGDDADAQPDPYTGDNVKQDEPDA